MLKCVECGSKAEQWHHTTPRCEGGVLVVPICRRCHVAHHSLAGDFARWGRLGGQVTAADPKHWKANLVQFRLAAERSAAARRGWATRRARAEVLASEQPFSSCKPGANSEPRASANAHVPVPPPARRALISVLGNPYARAGVCVLACAYVCGGAL